MSRVVINMDSEKKDFLIHKEPDQKDADRMLNEINTIMTSNGDEKVPLLRAELQESMTANAGVFRTEESLQKQKKKFTMPYVN